jgi:ribA/ribD-fused uncharacterized protein
VIDDFSKPGYEFYSNFFMAPVKYRYILYDCNESAFQSAKTLDMNKRLEFQHMKPGEAKRAGRKLVLRPYWETIKVDVMHDIVSDKFTRNPELRELLLANDEELVEGNNWHDTFWGICGGIGENHLGKILMLVRHEIRLQSKKGAV